MIKKVNRKKESFLKNLPENLIENCLSKFENKINFNFSFFDSSQGEDFKDWNQKQLSELLNKLKHYSKESAEHWKRERIGTKNSTVLKHPKHIPLDVEWARFRLEGSMRLIGFMISGAPVKTFKNLTETTIQQVE
ncbi:MAG: hypothetical protein ACOX2F_06720 [bacterium]